ncbi:hypothetical protein [Stakelama pacifica]|nr:hypothetical protein [Stakelama pacifica]GGO94472.1 hypothetical protein GCM10011329_16420 [Stakelama pacifica]
MTWDAYKIVNPDKPNEISRHTLDPDSELELFSKERAMGEYVDFRIEGKNTSIAFSASMVDLTEREKKTLGINEAVVWAVFAGIPSDDQEKKMISDALAAYKMRHGFTIKNLPTFVRFGRDPEVFHD